MPATNKPQPLIGLDISTSSVKLIELSRRRGAYRIDSYAAEPMPRDAVTDKAIADVDACGQAVKKALRRSGTRTRDVAVAIGGASVITKTILMPARLSDDERAQQIELQADQYIPYPIEEVRYDFAVTGPSAADPDMVDVLLVATRRENVENRQAVLDLAGLNAVVVDTEAYAVEAACELMTQGLSDEERKQSIGVVDFGATSTTFSIIKNNKIIYTRDQAFGGRQLTEEIMRHYGLSYEEAGRAKKQGGLPESYESELLTPFIDDMAQQLSRSMQFYLTSTNASEELSRIIICGGCATIEGAAERISERLDTPTQIGDPISGLASAARARAQLRENDGPSLVVACGLALRSFD